MWKFIDKMRRRPEHEQRAFAFTTAGAVTAVIFVVWLTVLIPVGGGESRERASIWSPFKSLGASVSSMWGSMKTEIESAKERMYPSEEFDAAEYNGGSDQSWQKDLDSVSGGWESSNNEDESTEVHEFEPGPENEI